MKIFAAALIASVASGLITSVAAGFVDAAGCAESCLSRVFAAGGCGSGDGTDCFCEVLPAVLRPARDCIISFCPEGSRAQAASQVVTQCSEANSNKGVVFSTETEPEPTPVESEAAPEPTTTTTTETEPIRSFTAAPDLSTTEVGPAPVAAPAPTTLSTRVKPDSSSPTSSPTKSQTSSDPPIGADGPSSTNTADTNTDGASPSDQNGSPSRIGPIVAGSVVGCAGLATLIAGTLFFLRRRAALSKRQVSSPQPLTVETPSNRITLPHAAFISSRKEKGGSPHSSFDSDADVDALPSIRGLSTIDGGSARYTVRFSELYGPRLSGLTPPVGAAGHARAAVQSRFSYD